MTGRVVEGPVTEAGRRLLDVTDLLFGPKFHANRTADILAIETEAAQAARAEVIAEIRGWAESNAVRADAMYSRAAVVGLAALRLALLPPTEPK